MYPRFVAIGLLGFALMTAAAFAQTYPQPGPDQPVRPQYPRLERRAPSPEAQRPAPPQPPPPPFTLTPQEEAQVDQVLSLWEQRNRKIKTFDCNFKRWIYDAVFPTSDPSKPLQPKYVELGQLKYAAPDQGLFRVDREEKGGREVAIHDSRAECWICDGKSIFEYKYKTKPKQLIEHKLPPDLQGKAIADSPLPFMFGSEAQKLKQRYFIRFVTPSDVKDQIWLEAYPRTQQDAANFHHAQFIITTQGLSPFALRIVHLNRKDYTVYQFYDIVVNDPLKFFHGNPFRPYTPMGWQKIVEEPPPSPSQAHRRTSNDSRR